MPKPDEIEGVKYKHKNLSEGVWIEDGPVGPGWAHYVTSADQVFIGHEGQADYVYFDPGLTNSGGFNSLGRDVLLNADPSEGDSLYLAPGSSGQRLYADADSDGFVEEYSFILRGDPWTGYDASFGRYESDGSGYSEQPAGYVHFRPWSDDAVA